MNQLLAFSNLISTIGYIFIAILVLLLMVLIHELGHYIAGKILKFKINEFSVGFGPKILQKKNKSGELVTLRAIPLGGYCAFEGEGEENKDNPKSFSNQKPWKRLIVLFSGAFFNFLSAIIFSFILLLANGYDLVEVKNVGSHSINYQQLQTGDVIYGIENEKIDFVSDKSFNALITITLQDNCKKYDGELDALKSFTKDGDVFYTLKKSLLFNIKRNNKPLAVNGYINVVYDDEGTYAGWSLLQTNTENDTEFEIGTYKYSFGESLAQCVPFTFKWAWKILVIFGQLLTGQLALTSLGGPFTTIGTIATTAQQNLTFLLVLMPVIAVNLAVFNLLPIPALDGFQMIFTGIEWVRKKPVKQNIINMVNNIGLILLLGFVLIIDGIHIFSAIF